MFMFILGFCSGIYVGTYYDCKPSITKIEYFIEKYIPKKKAKKKTWFGKSDLN